MIVTIYHDDLGHIVALVARPQDAPASDISLQLPVRSIEIQDPTLDDFEPTEIHNRIAQLKNSHKVEIGDAAGRLVER